MDAGPIGLLFSSHQSQIRKINAGTKTRYRRKLFLDLFAFSCLIQPHAVFRLPKMPTLLFPQHEKFLQSTG
jgi:hypothetical protein